MSTQDSDSGHWQPDLYEGKHSFVWQLGLSVVELLAPRPGEWILDLGFLGSWRNDREDEFFPQLEDAARPTLLRDSVWHADYRRLRIVAFKWDEA